MPDKKAEGGITAEAGPLAGFLLSGCFHVPRYQRLYDWNKEQVQDFLTDLETCINEEREEHFFGAIMLKPLPGEEGKYEINDGQQRIVTFTLICAQLAEYFGGMEDSYGRTIMIRVLFNLGDVRELKVEDASKASPRVTMSNKEHKTVYESLIREEGVRRGGKIVGAQNIIKNFLEKHQDDKEWLIKFRNFILESVVVVKVCVPTKTDTQTIFEVLNARGKPLMQTDLIRSYIYSQFGEEDNRGETVEQFMESLSGSLVAKGEKALEEYVRCHAQMLYGYLTANRFYRDIREKTSSEKDRAGEIFSFVKQLREKIEIYNTIRKPPQSRKLTKDDVHFLLLDSIKKDAGESRSRRDMVDFMRDIEKYSVAHPVAFALLSRYFDSNGSKEKKKSDAKLAFVCCKLLASFVQRSSHCFGAFKPSLYEKRMSELAKSVFHRTCNTPDEFLGKIKECDSKNMTPIIPDASYIDMMRVVNFSRKSTDQPRYILARISEYKRDNILVDDCQIEHILPKSPVYWGGWKGFGGGQGERYVHRLGNMTLLESGRDSPSTKANESFSRKKKTYEGSLYRITSDLHKYEEWRPEEIDRRQKELARLAAKVWNFDL